MTKNNQTGQNLDDEDKLMILNKMKERARKYAMKEGSSENEAFSFDTVMIVNNLLEKSVKDVAGEMIYSERSAKKKGKNFDSLTVNEKRFLRPDLL